MLIVILLQSLDDNNLLVIVSKLVIKTLLPPIVGEKNSNKNPNLEGLENIDFSDNDIIISILN